MGVDRRYNLFVYLRTKYVGLGQVIFKGGRHKCVVVVAASKCRLKFC